MLAAHFVFLCSQAQLDFQHRWFMRCVLAGWGIFIGTCLSMDGFAQHRFKKLHKVTPKTGGASDHFGSCVSVDGDFALIGTTVGSAYVFRRTGKNWTIWQRFETHQSGRTSVSLRGDVALVGVAGEDVGDGKSVGAAYVFRRGGTQWLQEARLTASDGAAGDQFGFSVSVRGNTLMIGAPWAKKGCVYVFRHSDKRWIEEQQLTAKDVGSCFGYSVCLDRERAVIGAIEFADWFPGRGCALMFRKVGEKWVREQKLTASDGRRGDRFGRSVCMAEEMAIVGAPYHTFGSGFRQGAVYAFRYDGVQWTQAQKLSASKLSNHFGWSTNMRDQLVLVGAPWRDRNARTGKKRGSAFVFRYDGTQWIEGQSLSPSDRKIGDNFGQAVALSETTALVGVPNHGSPVTYAGAAYFFGKVNPRGTDRHE